MISYKKLNMSPGVMMGSDYDLELGKNISEVRKQLHITQVELSEITGISVDVLGKIERGRTACKTWQLKAIAMGLGVPMIQLCPGSVSDVMNKKLLTLLYHFDSEKQELIFEIGSSLDKYFMGGFKDIGN